MTSSQIISFPIVCLQELQKAVDKRKATVLSINLCSAEFVQSATEESQDLQARLKEMNNRWDRLATSLGEWRAALQKALMQCHVGVQLSIHLAWSQICVVLPTPMAVKELTRQRKQLWDQAT